jgi:CheY-like chemotaxis protein
MIRHPVARSVQRPRRGLDPRRDAVSEPDRPDPILLVEDNMLNEMVAVGMLRLLGRTADVALNGVEAIAALERRPYRIVLMDVAMPVMDGLEATRRIRSDLPAERQPYIIALTANAMAGDEQRCLDAGMDAYLAKPLSKNQLADALAAAERTAPSE